MKTTVDIPDDMLAEAQKASGATTKRQAILTALGEYNRRHRLARLRDLLGSLDTLMTNDDLRRHREDG